MRRPRPPRKPLPGGKAARNERRKLRATSLNAFALTIAAIGILQPAFSGQFAPLIILRMAMAATATYVIHEFAIQLLKDLED